ncbi:hypothetical protein E2562_033184 [Oryza meyeriana var. granulata]|uniref:DUF1618 domain-containing protein n=1 Tax=Oryza meyeriana var. granulata TaxID=110450 RepID=A0A6G1DQE8_9ORYZ|nr:hypothetical protein E2562_033184 [Oryza meyeriana var. granulata]
MAESLELYARLAEKHPDRSQLAVCADEEIIRYIDHIVEFDEIHWMPSVTAFVRAADKNLLVVSISFAFSTAEYYFVYDATLASLSMIPLPRCCCTIHFPSNPLPVRYGDAYALVLFAKNYEYQGEEGFTYGDVLCLWSPSMT